MTAVIETPDLDALVLAALRDAELPAAVLVPAALANSMPLIVAHAVSGGSATRLGTLSGIVDLQSFARTRAEAASLARSAVSALQRACLAQYAAGGSHLLRYADVTGAPVEIRTGSPAPDVTLFRFQTTCRISARTSL